MSKLATYGLFCLTITIIVDAKVYFEENFSDDSWENEWTYSEYPGKEYGKFVRSAGYFYHDAEADKGIQTSQDNRFYALSRKFTPFSNEGKDLIVQFTVKHEQDIDCGGGYIKLFNCDLEPEKLHGETPYEIMFGPDICGTNAHKVHIIFNYNGKNLLYKKEINKKNDIYTHLYTLIVKPDNTYEVFIDTVDTESGELEADWDFLPPKKIKHPKAEKPEYWDDRQTIDDPRDEKPEDWDKPEFIPDPAAIKPEDWSDEIDGEWEPAMINNPDFKGEWKPKQIKNPNYKGQWVHPEIDNPEYKPDNKLYLRKEICAIGFDLWQVKSGTIFNNILITDDVEEAKDRGKTFWVPRYDGEWEVKKDEEEEEEEEEGVKEEVKEVDEKEKKEDGEKEKIVQETKNPDEEPSKEDEKEKFEEPLFKTEDAHDEL